MTLLLDTAAVPAADRDDATRAAVERMSVPTEVSLLGTGPRDTRMDFWQMGRLSALRNEGRALRLLRTPQHVRRDAPEVVSMNIQLKGRALHHQGGHTQQACAGELVMADLSGTYESNTGLATLATYMSYSDLGVEVAVGRRAMPRLAASPLYALVRNHLAQLNRCIDATWASPGAHEVGDATIDLVRALLVSAAQDTHENDILAETLSTRVEAYIRQNLTDTHLNPETIARTHHISVRALYNLWSTRDSTLMEWIIRERLEGAREELRATRSAASTPTVSHVARRWGFSDPTHFRRRFRAAYGMSPTEWRRWCASDALADPRNSVGMVTSPVHVCRE